MSVNVGQLIKNLEGAVAELKKLDPKMQAAHYLMPDGCYSGDIEDTFNKIKVEVDEKENMVVLNLHY